jgi:hypothetical protein
MKNGLTNTMLYGARSGIQKAVRRGDPSLAKTCFDILWSIPAHRKWLLSRFRSIVFEDCWIMAGEYAKAVDSLGEKPIEDVMFRAGWLTFLLRLTIAKKNQDCGWGWHVVRHSENPVNFPEYKLVQKVFSFAVGGDPSKAGGKAEEYLSGIRELDAYEKAAFREAKRRSSLWGLESDRWMGLMAMALIVGRGLPEEEILEMLSQQKTRFSGVKVKTVAELPYYCFDMHTRPGKLALRVLKKSYVYGHWPPTRPKEALEPLVFHYMSAVVGESVWSPELLPIDYGQDVRVEWEEQAWFSLSKWSLAKWCDSPSPQELRKWFFQEVEPKLRELIQWAVKKSLEDER